MKISILNNLQHRELPTDFTERYHSNWVDPPWHELASPEQYSRFYWSSIEEHVYAANKGFDAVALNEHHQDCFGGLPNPNVLAGALAHATRDLEVAIFQIGATLTTNVPPNRVAEEYAMLDLLSEGRLIAGMPVGTPMDALLAYWVRPLDQRGRYVEAHDLILKAWASTEPFIWNGKYFQLAVRQRLAVADPAAASAHLGPRRGERIDLGHVREARPRIHGAHRGSAASSASPTRSGS